MQIYHFTLGIESYFPNPSRQRSDQSCCSGLYVLLDSYRISSPFLPHQTLLSFNGYHRAQKTIIEKKTRSASFCVQ